MQWKAGMAMRVRTGTKEDKKATASSWTPAHCHKACWSMCLSVTSCGSVTTTPLFSCVVWQMIS